MLMTKQEKTEKLLEKSRNRASMIKCKSELALLDPSRSQNTRLAEYMRNRGTFLSSRYGNESFLAGSQHTDQPQHQR